mmetsp:Transcript_18784/g.40418  ORF Transcript_18784/g.40418 Transcript_18784/m.40418 type:complete len:211 (+) Transcript_18784:1946-2578(+)
MPLSDEDREDSEEDDDMDRARGGMLKSSALMAACHWPACTSPNMGKLLLLLLLSLSKVLTASCGGRGPLLLWYLSPRVASLPAISTACATHTPGRPSCSGSTASSSPAALPAASTMAPTRKLKSEAPTSTPSSTYTTALRGSMATAMGSSWDTMCTTSVSLVKRCGHTGAARHRPADSSVPSPTPSCSRRLVILRAAATSCCPMLTAIMV